MHAQLWGGGEGVGAGAGAGDSGLRARRFEDHVVFAEHVARLGTREAFGVEVRVAVAMAAGI